MPPPLEKVAVLVDSDPKPPAHHVLRRGVHNSPGAEVQPGVVSALDPRNTFHIDSPAPGKGNTGRRTAFARWVASPEHPLFARVMVNRIWQHHFGTGLASTPDNLGKSGAKPTHAQLLDYLATEFVRSGWSVKALHRMIMNSAVYRQSARIADCELRIAESKSSNPQSAIVNPQSIDPDNRWLWRYPLRRLDAEAVRDAMLSISGELEGRLGGPYVPTKRTPDGSVAVEETRADARRRSVYLQQRRTQVTTLLELFDSPAMVSTCGQRPPSTVHLQALALLNSSRGSGPRRSPAVCCKKWTFRMRPN